MDFRDAIAGAAQSWFCGNLDTAERLNGYFDRLNASRNGVGIAISAVSAPIRNLGRQLASCPASGGPYPPSPPGPNFSGGQCSALYTVTPTVQLTNPTTGAVTSLVGNPVQNVPGPVVSTNTTFSGNNSVVRAVSGGGGETIIFTEADPTVFVSDVLGLSFQRADGEPDNCGDPPGGIGAPGTLPITYDGIDGTPVTENVQVQLGDPYLTADGDVVVPVTVNGPGYSITANLSTSTGDIGFGEPNIPTDGGRCCPDEAPDVDPPDSPEDPPVDDGRIIQGVFVIATSVSSSAEPTQVMPPDGPSLFFPRLGSVTFGIRKGTATGWLNPIDVQNRSCYIPCPDAAGAIDVKSFQVPGVDLTVTPVYAVVSTLDSMEGM